MKLQTQNENAGELQSEVNHPSDDGSGVATAQESRSLSIERSGSQGLGDRKGTGPRTEQGKQRASRNATKHGVFSKVIVLKSESGTEYEGLLAGLREALQPEGTLEELLVEKLAALAWRQRRLLLAESAEIRKNTEFVESDQRKQELEAAERLCGLAAVLDSHGLIRKIHNPNMLEYCLRLLGELREGIQEVGLRPEQDILILQRIYGSRDEQRLDEDLYDSYEAWLQTAETAEEEREREGYASPAKCRERILEEIDEEIRRLKRDQKARASIEARRTQLEILRRNIPDAPGLDRLLRYEASLERSFDRTLSQLERLQRMRRGQAVPPPIEVNVSST